jgi:actin-related protein
VLNIKYPIQQGIINKWNEMGEIWQHILIEKLNIDPQDRLFRE